MHLTLSYADFMQKIIERNMLPRVQYVFCATCTPAEYALFAMDDQYVFEATARGTDRYDFEAKYKAKCGFAAAPRNVEGITVISPSLDDTLGYFPKKRMVKYVVKPLQCNIFDEVVTVERRINGGEYWIYEDDVDKVHRDDYVEFSVVDKNDVLGLFSKYGLVVGQGILELTKFVNTEYVKKGNKSEGYHSQLYEGIKGTNKVVPGLFLRTYYFAYGSVGDIELLSKVFYYE